MSEQNPHVQSPRLPEHDAALQPKSADFIETPDIDPLSMEKESFPLWAYLLCGLFLFLTGSSFTGFQIFGRDLLDQGPGGPTLSSNTQAAETPLTPAEMGKKIYGNNCASCHDASGMGAPGKYPPLADSEWVNGSKERLTALLLKGIDGPLNVKGATYTAAVMPGQEATLTPEKIANVLTYIRSAWGNKTGPVTAEEVTAAKGKFTSHASAYTEAELLQIAQHGPDPTDKK